MNKIWVVVRREYLERVRKKSFWIGTLIFPLLMTLLFGGQFALMKLKTPEQRRIAIVDQTAELAQPVMQELAQRLIKEDKPEFLIEEVPIRGSLDETLETLKPRVSSSDLYGVVLIGNEIESRENFRFFGRNVADIQAVKAVESAVHDAVVELRLERSDLQLERESLDRLMAPVNFSTYQVTDSGETKKKGFLSTYIGTFVFVMILYMSLLLYGVAVMRGVLEEKSNRIMEVLLGSLSPEQLMTGKILGIGLVGLTQIGFYVVTVQLVRFLVLSEFGFVGGLSSEVIGAFDAFTPFKLFFFLVYFVLGFFMYTALFATVGAVCNSEQEAQNLQGPVIMCLVIPMVATFFFVTSPDSMIATVVSLVPLFTPMVMFMRISVLTPPAWQIALSLLLMVGTIWLFFRGAAKVFRLGILMYGKRPSIREMWRWAWS